MSHIKTKRIDSLDFLRCFAIVIMVTWHFVGFIADGVTGYMAVIRQIIYVIGSLLSVPLFIVCAGISSSYSCKIKMRNNISLKDIRRYSIQRGLVLYFIGVGYTAVIHGINSIAYMWILQCIGLCIVVGALSMHSKQRCILLFLLSLATVPLIIFFAFDSLVTEKILLSELTVWGFLRTTLISGNFAVLLWVPFFWLGNILGHFLFDAIFNKKKITYKIFVIGSGMLLAGCLLNYVSDFVLAEAPLLNLSINKYPVSITYILIYGGISVLLFDFLFYYLDYRNIEMPLKRIIRMFSTLSLSIFCIHYLLGLIFVCKGIGMLSNNPVMGIIATVIFFIILYQFFLWWERYHFKYSLEYIMKNFTSSLTTKIL